MKIIKARVQNYRSIIDSEEFNIDNDKTILVGPNEAGKTALLQAIQHLNPPKENKPLNPLRDYPRAHYSKINTGEVDPSTIRVVEGEFELSDDERKDLPETMKKSNYVLWRNLDNSEGHRLTNSPTKKKYKDLENDLIELAEYAETLPLSSVVEADSNQSPIYKLKMLTREWNSSDMIEGEKSQALIDFFTDLFDNLELPFEETLYDKVMANIEIGDEINKALDLLRKRVPIFVLFSNYFRVRPLIHLKQLATRIDEGHLDSKFYDYGNVCLLKLIGSSAKELSEMDVSVDPSSNDWETYRDKKDERQYLLNAAEVRLTTDIENIWKPDKKKKEVVKLRIRADGQYLKVAVEDDLGVEVEIDQRSEGFQWLVSFFVVFFAEAQEKHKNAILLLDEPGLSLHALKQREFRKTITRLAKSNQTFYTTHSPFLVGPDELDMVRVVEMGDRKKGTKVHTSITAKDPAAILPLQEALGYDLAQTLFSKRQNLVLEGLTDYWYLEAVSQLLRASNDADLNENIALVPANTAGKVVYFATILQSQGFKVAALLDSDSAGDQAAKQDTLVHILRNRRILRTKDYLQDEVNAAEVEDLLRDTLTKIAKSEFNWDVTETAPNQPNRALISILKNEAKNFSKYKLAKAFIKWSRDHTAEDLSQREREQWKKLINTVNSAFK